MVWYPSIGAHREKSGYKSDGTLVTSACRWINTAMCQEPVNQAVEPIRMYNPEEVAKAILGIETDAKLRKIPLYEITAEAAISYALKGVGSLDELIKKYDLAESEQEALFDLLSACVDRTVAA